MCDNNFRHQLSLKEKAFQDMLQESLVKKDEELASERSKVRVSLIHVFVSAVSLNNQSVFYVCFAVYLCLGCKSRS